MVSALVRSIYPRLDFFFLEKHQLHMELDVVWFFLDYLTYLTFIHPIPFFPLGFDAYLLSSSPLTSPRRDLTRRFHHHIRMRTIAARRAADSRFSHPSGHETIYRPPLSYHPASRQIRIQKGNHNEITERNQGGRRNRRTTLQLPLFWGIETRALSFFFPSFFGTFLFLRLFWGCVLLFFL